MELAITRRVGAELVEDLLRARTGTRDARRVAACFLIAVTNHGSIGVRIVGVAQTHVVVGVPGPACPRGVRCALLINQLQVGSMTDIATSLRTARPGLDSLTAAGVSVRHPPCEGAVHVEVDNRLGRRLKLPRTWPRVHSKPDW
jgi:hypothetical protein